MKPSAAAEMIGIAPNTLRLWATQFAKHLSPTGAPGPGRQRDLTDSDLKIIYAIKQAKDNGLSTPEIQIMLDREAQTDYANLRLPPTRLTGEVPLVPAAVMDDQYRFMAREIDLLRRELAEERTRGEQKDARILELERIAARAEMELELWRAGRLKPDTGN